MKLVIKIFSFIVLTTSHITFCSQQTTHDNRQFLHEQDAKIRSAQVNAAANDQLVAEQLQEEENAAQAKDLQLIAQDDAHTKDLRSWMAENCVDKAGKKCEKLATLPDPIVYHILEFHYGDPQKLKFIAHNMHKLIPAVVSWRFPNAYTLFGAINSCKEQNLRTQMYKFGSNFSSGDRSIRPSEEPAYINESSAFVAYKLPQWKEPVFKVCPTKFKLLELLSMDQLQFIINLYNKQDNVRRYCRNSNNIQTFIIPRKPTKEEITIYKSLPEKVRECLELNYGRKTTDLREPNSLPRKMVVIVQPKGALSELDGFNL